MKKLFMIAAIAALGLGAYSCENSSGGDNGGGADGAETALQITLTLPAGSGATRANDWNPIVAQDYENAVETVDVFLFNSSGAAVSPATIHHQRVPITDFTPSGNVYTMKKSGIPAVTGTNMRIWVALNLTDAIGATESFANEDALRARFDEIADMTVKGEFTMFSNATPKTIEAIPVGKTFEDMNPGTDSDNWNFNRVNVNVFRVTSKVVATAVDNPALTVDWDATTSNENLLLNYSLKHWWVFQHATSSWIAPRYVVDNVTVNNSTTLPRPVTYDQAISDYDDDAVMNTWLFIQPQPSGSAADQDLSAFDAAERKAKYIGENARFGGSEATNGETTHAFISTQVVANQEVVWDPATEAMKWQAANAPYGGVTSPTSVWLIKYAGADYITSSEDNVRDIASGLAALEGIYVVEDIKKLNPADDDPKYRDDPDYGDDYVEGSISGTPMMKADFYEKINFHAYHYREGYVHFLVWINRVGTTQNHVMNQYEVLRNQFIHLKINGIDQATMGTFPGYPGDKENPEIPIDPTVDNPDNPNPDPLIPTDPVDPEAAKMLVNVEVRDWTYRLNDTWLSK